MLSSPVVRGLQKKLDFGICSHEIQERCVFDCLIRRYFYSSLIGTVRNSMREISAQPEPAVVGLCGADGFERGPGSGISCADFLPLISIDAPGKRRTMRCCPIRTASASEAGGATLNVLRYIREHAAEGRVRLPSLHSAVQGDGAVESNGVCVCAARRSSLPRLLTASAFWSSIPAGTVSACPSILPAASSFPPCRGFFQTAADRRCSTNL